jgi:hypothetical protein
LVVIALGWGTFTDTSANTRLLQRIGWLVSSIALGGLLGSSAYIGGVCPDFV